MPYEESRYIILNAWRNTRTHKLKNEYIYLQFAHISHVFQGPRTGYLKTASLKLQFKTYIPCMQKEQIWHYVFDNRREAIILQPFSG